MILQPKSSNLPETQKNPSEAIVSAAGLNMIAGSENAAVNLNGKGAEEKKKATMFGGEDAAQATPRQEKKTPIKEEKPVLGQ